MISSRAARRIRIACGIDGRPTCSVSSRDHSPLLARLGQTTVELGETTL